MSGHLSEEDEREGFSLKKIRVSKAPLTSDSDFPGIPAGLSVLTARPPLSASLEAVSTASPRRLVISKDYDNCAFVLNSESPFMRFYLNQKPNVRTCLNKLETFITEYAEGYDEILSLVGSNRQTLDLENLAREQNKEAIKRWCGKALDSGYAHKAYERYVAKKNQSGDARWIFDPYSAYDTIYGHDHEPGWSYRSSGFHNPGFESLKADKVALLKYQMQHARSRYPEGPLTFLFIDDYPEKDKMREAQQAYFSSAEGREFLMGLKITFECRQYDFAQIAKFTSPKEISEYELPKIFEFIFHSDLLPPMPKSISKPVSESAPMPVSTFEFDTRVLDERIAAMGLPSSLPTSTQLFGACMLGTSPPVFEDSSVKP